jgi:hypothetical protein
MGTAGAGALGGAVLLALRSDTAGLGALVGRMAPLVGLRWRCSPCPQPVAERAGLLGWALRSCCAWRAATP